MIQGGARLRQERGAPDLDQMIEKDPDGKFSDGRLKKTNIKMANLLFWPKDFDDLLVGHHVFRQFVGSVVHFFFNSFGQSFVFSALVRPAGFGKKIRPAGFGKYSRLASGIREFFASEIFEVGLKLKFRS